MSSSRFPLSRSGNGGDGEITEKGKGRWVDNFKYRPNSSLPKRIWLPAGEPADGMDGADVMLVVDPEYDDLMHLHGRGLFQAKKGSNGDPNLGTQAPKTMKKAKLKQEPLMIPVPPGTTVRKKNGGVLAELIQPGDRFIVLEGGPGGMGVEMPTRDENTARVFRAKDALFNEDEVVDVDDANWKLDAKGGMGAEATLILTLRVVADIGLVGLPNAGKSSLLATMTRATPEIAPYPFTTLMPNLGVMRSAPSAEDQGTGIPDLEGIEWGDIDWETVDPDMVDEIIARERAKAGIDAGSSKKAPILADLPGLIEGAHVGRGLGRMFLRHLKRTRALLQVIDASSPNVESDYWVVREELRMYNPEYTRRPHVVALNKIDLVEDQEHLDSLVDKIMTVARELKAAQPEDDPGLPLHVVAVSAAQGTNLEDLEGAIQEAIEAGGEVERRSVGTGGVLVTRRAGITVEEARAGASPDI